MAPDGNELFPADEHTDLVPRIVRAKRLLVAVSLATAVVAAAAALLLPALVPPGPAQVSPATRAAIELEAKSVASAIEANTHAAQVRATRIAGTPMVRAAVMTDAATVADMMKSDFQYTPIKDERLVEGETLELFQVHGDQISSLGRIPSTAPPIPPLRGKEVRIDPVGDGLKSVVSWPVEAIKDGPGYPPGVSGSIALAIPIDLGFVKKQLATDAVDATIVGLSSAVALVHGTDVGGAPLRLPLVLRADWHLAPMVLEVIPKRERARPAWVEPARYACAGLALVMLVVAGLAWLRRR